MRGVIGMCAALITTAALAAGPWYPPTEPSPLIPDGARRLFGGTGKLTNFRGTWQVRGPVRRAVLCVAPYQTTRVYLNGTLVAEAYDTHQATPAWAEVADVLRPGPLAVAARVGSEWRPALYLQMRVEYQDGTWEDLTTGPGWQWCDQPSADWINSPAAGGDWQPCTDAGGYAIDDTGFWGREFALLPRDALREHFRPHNEALQASWATDRQAPGLLLRDPPEQPRWAAQFRTFSHLDDATGQLIDGAGRVRHLFFTIYSQPGTLSVETMDLDRLERDLDLMAAADVHLYMRMTGWSWLLDERGNWAKLKRQPPGAGDRHFEYGYELVDHLVRRAWAHGRYLVFEGDFYWGANAIVPPPYRTRYHLYPEVAAAQALAMRKIMNRYRDCPNVLGMMIGEEDIVLEHDLQNPHQQALFADFLRRKYGTIEEFKRQTPWGYDYADRSAYAPGKSQGERWPDHPEEVVLVPGFVARQDPFAARRDFADMPLPLWPWQMDPQRPDVARGGWRSYNQFSPEDPLWIDFYEMREDELLFGMLSRRAQTVRQGMPRQLLFYSNAQDFTNSWHFLHLYRRADLPFDVIGVGCHDADQNLSELPAWATVRKSIKVISSYRPYALAPGSLSRGVASGEGQGGKPTEPQEVLNYYRGALMDEIGGGAAWTQTYAWDCVSGAVAGQEPHLTPLLQWLGEFMPQVQGVAFPLRRPVQVLIVRNTNLAHTNQSGLDYDNVMQVAEALTQLNVEFDIVMDRDLVYRAQGDAARYKIDLQPYRLVILPCLAINPPDSALATLDQWLSDSRAPAGRTLVLGWNGQHGPRLQPLTSFPPRLQRWLGTGDYAGTVALNGKQSLTLLTGAQPRTLAVDCGRIPPVGILPGGVPVLRAPAGETIGARYAVGGGHAWALGFPMGFAHEPLWGLAPQQQPRDALVPLYDAMLSAAGVDRPVLAPHNLRVCVSDGGACVLVRERAGLATEDEIAVRIPPGVRYPNVPMSRTGDGYARLRLRLQPWEGLCLRAQ